MNAELLDDLREAYPARWGHLLVPVDGKRPIEKEWNRLALERWESDGDPARRLQEVADHWSQGGNVGLAVPPGVLVLDADDPSSCRYLDQALPDVPVQESRLGHRHYVVEAPPGLEISGKVKVELEPGVLVDLRAAGKNQIVVWPSRHPETGGQYHWLRSLPLDPGRLPSLPARLQEAVRRAVDDQKPGHDAVHSDVFRHGEQHHRLVSLAGAMRRLGLDAEEIEPALQAVNERRCERPGTKREIHAIAASTAAWERGEWPVLPPQSREEVRASEPRILLLSEEDYLSDLVPDAIVEGLIYPGHLHTTNAPSKSGKTFLALQIALCAASGLPFLGLPTRRCRVLIVNLEMSAALIRQRIEAISQDVMLPTPEFGRDLHVIAPTHGRSVSLDLRGSEGRAELRANIEKAGAEYVVIDTFQKAAPGADPNDNGQMAELFGHLGDLARDTRAGLQLIDHSRKGDQPGYVSQSGLGAQAKGAAAAVVMAVTRTSKDQGGAWELDVESHFGNWDQPIAYRRPVRPDGSLGFGCEPCSRSEARGLDFKTVEKLFRSYGERDESDRPQFASQNALKKAVQEAGLASENSSSGADAVIDAIKRDYCAGEDALESDWKNSRPIWTGSGQRNSIRFLWRMAS